MEIGVIRGTTTHSNTSLAAFLQLYSALCFGIHGFHRMFFVITFIKTQKLYSKEVGVAGVTTRTHLAVFLLIAKHKFYINCFANNCSFQQSKVES